jgi:hypothetical protein
MEAGQTCKTADLHLAKGLYAGKALDESMEMQQLAGFVLYILDISVRVPT